MSEENGNVSVVSAFTGCLYLAYLVFLVVGIIWGYICGIYIWFMLPVFFWALAVAGPIFKFIGCHKEVEFFSDSWYLVTVIEFTFEQRFLTDKKRQCITIRVNERKGERIKNFLSLNGRSTKAHILNQRSFGLFKGQLTVKFHKSSLFVIRIIGNT